MGSKHSIVLVTYGSKVILNLEPRHVYVTILWAMSTLHQITALSTTLSVHCAKLTVCYTSASQCVANHFLVSLKGINGQRTMTSFMREHGGLCVFGGRLNGPIPGQRQVPPRGE